MARRRPAAAGGPPGAPRRAHADGDPAAAIACGEAVVPYGELARRAEEMAVLLRRLGVWPGSRVALLLDASPELAAAALAVWKAGGVCLPLDPAAPAVSSGHRARRRRAASPGPSRRAARGPPGQRSGPAGRVGPAGARRVPLHVSPRRGGGGRGPRGARRRERRRPPRGPDPGATGPARAAARGAQGGARPPAAADPARERPRTGAGDWPLSFDQERLWFLSLARPAEHRLQPDRGDAACGRPGYLRADLGAARDRPPAGGVAHGVPGGRRAARAARRARAPPAGAASSTSPPCRRRGARARGAGAGQRGLAASVRARARPARAGDACSGSRPASTSASSRSTTSSATG